MGQVGSQEVISGLYIGGRQAAVDYEDLQAKGITHIVTVSVEKEQPYIGELKYLHISALDVESQNLLVHFDECNQFIDRALQEGGKVLVHCQAGVSRSATVTAAYVMWKKKVGAEEALKMVEAARESIHPNAGFVEQLRLYEKLGYNVDENDEEYVNFWKKVEEKKKSGDYL